MTTAQLHIFSAIATAYRNANLPLSPYIHRSHSSRMTLQQIYDNIRPIQNPMTVGHIFGRVINATFLCTDTGSVEIETTEPWLTPDFRIHYLHKLSEIKERLSTNQFQP